MSPGGEGMMINAMMIMIIVIIDNMTSFSSSSVWRSLRRDGKQTPTKSLSPALLRWVWGSQFLGPGENLEKTLYQKNGPFVLPSLSMLTMLPLSSASSSDVMGFFSPCHGEADSTPPGPGTEPVGETAMISSLDPASTIYLGIRVPQLPSGFTAASTNLLAGSLPAAPLAL